MPAAIGAALIGLFGGSVAAAGATTAGILVISAATATAIGSIVLSIAVSLTLSFVAKALQKTPNFNSVASQNRTVTVRQAVSPWRIVYGSVGQLGGVITFMQKTGSSGEYLHLVITLAGHQLQAIGNLYFDGVQVPLDGSGDATGTFAGLVHCETHDGDPTDTAQPFPSLVTASAGEWKSTHLQRGRAKAWVRLKWNADKFPNGIPNITFDVLGALVYDPRTSTTAYSNNAALCLRDYLTNKTYGLGADTSEIDDDSFTAAANICDESVTLKDTTTENRYECNGVSDTSIAVGDGIEALLTACAGNATYIAGTWQLVPAAWRASDLTLTEDDLDGPINVQVLQSSRDICNGVKGVFVSEGNKWQPADFPAVIRAKYVAEDSGKTGTLTEKYDWLTATAYAVGDCVMNNGSAWICISAHTSGGTTEPGVGASYATKWEVCSEIIWKDIELHYTTSATAAQRIAKIILERTRRQLTVQWPGRLGCYQLQAQDVCAITRDRYGWTDKTFEVSHSALTFRGDDSNRYLGVDLVLQESDEDVYAWDETVEEHDATDASDVTLPDPTDTVDPTSLVLTSGTLTGTDGIKRSYIDANWTAAADEFVISGGHTYVEYKKHADSTWIQAAKIGGLRTTYRISPVDDGVLYDVRIYSENSYGVQGGVVSGTVTPSGSASNFTGQVNSRAASAISTAVLSDSTFATSYYHKSAFRLKATTSRTGTNTETLSFVTVSSFTVHIPPGATAYKGTLTAQKIAAGGPSWDVRARLKIGAQLSSEVQAVNPTTSNSATATVTGLTADSDITVEVQVYGDFGGSGGTVRGTFNQVQYTDQDLDNLV